jgi:hypothetical protein
MSWTSTCSAQSTWRAALTRLVAEAHLGGWEDDRVGIDQRYLALRQWLSDTTRERYAADWIDPPDRDPDDMPHPTEAHIALLDDLDRLERLWELV